MIDESPLEPGDQVGQLTLVSRVLLQEPSGRIRSYWVVLCSCGRRYKVRTSRLAHKQVSTCKVCSTRLFVERGTTHGARRDGEASPTYRTWHQMIRRCEDTKAHGYANYGGRGVTVCSRWRTSFTPFLEDMGPRPSKHSIDRIDSRGNYEPGNCRWATRKEQARNRRNNTRLTVDSETLCIVEWSERVGITASTLSTRIRAGWSARRAVMTPVRGTQ